MGHPCSKALFVFLLAAALAQSVPVAGSSWVPASPHVTSYAAVLIEWQTGSVLFQKNGFTRMHPASVTKIMTALLALERGRLDDEVEVSEEAADQPGSSMYLAAGQVWRLEDLLFGLMLHSGNDAAWAIAEHVGGTASGFFQMMNDRAREIGAVNTHFENPHGLTSEEHYTTAYDLALIARTCLRHPFFVGLAATKEKDVTDLLGVTTKLVNTNRLLWLYPGADGVKTGTTESAGQCLVASATRGDTRLLSVVLDSYDRWSDSAVLLDHGFDNYRVARLAAAGEELWAMECKGATTPTVPLVTKTDLLACVPKDAIGLEVKYQLPSRLSAPCPRGTVVGRVVVWFGGKVAGSADLATGEWVRDGGPGATVIRTVSRLAEFMARRLLF